MMMDTTKNKSIAYIGLGANLGAAKETVSLAAQALHAHPQIAVLTLSSIIQTKPWQAVGPDFFNAVAKVETSFKPLDLLSALQAIETQFGRQRPYLNAPRTLDLDLLLYDQMSLNHPSLIIPHPRMHERDFVLRPLLEIAPEITIPVHGSAKQCLENLSR